MIRAGILAILVLSGSACATTGPDRASGDTAEGYLADDVIRGLAEAIPPPPPQGSPTALNDVEISNRYRVLEGGDRWLLATAHAELGAPLAAQHFDCALGTRFGQAEMPALTRLMDRLLHDSEDVADRVKRSTHRPRPVADDPNRPACQRVNTAGRNSASYPSSSAGAGAIYGEMFAALAPDRAEAARRIGHEIGVSRLVCAMHYPSDVAAGEAYGTAVYAAAARTPKFQADLRAARTEVETARRTGLTNPGCVAEAAALAQPLP